MKNIKTDGGPAFPTIRSRYGMNGNSSETDKTGMSLRQYIAIKAMQGSLAHGTRTNMSKEEFIQRLVETSYQIADAMIEEGSK